MAAILSQMGGGVMGKRNHSKSPADSGPKRGKGGRPPGGAARPSGVSRFLSPFKKLKKKLKRPTAVPTDLARIEALLIEHLGSKKAADAWLDSPDTGYPTTARDAIDAGHAEYVLQDLLSQWGPSPSYA